VPLSAWLLAFYWVTRSSGKTRVADCADRAVADVQSRTDLGLSVWVQHFLPLIFV